MLALANKLLESGTASDTRGPYTILDPAQRFEIGKKAAEIGTTVAIRYYANRYRNLLPLKETTVQRWKDLYRDKVKDQAKEAARRSHSPDSDNEESNSVVQELVPKKRGRPLLIGEDLDHQVREYINVSSLQCLPVLCQEIFFPFS